MNTLKNYKIKIIILAAGSGRRLKMDMPKAMVKLREGMTILDHQLKNLLSWFDVDDVSIVVGYKKEMLMEQYSQLTYVYNKHFDITNTARSLCLGLRKLRDNDVLWLNGDVVFDLDILKDVVKNRDRNLICVNNNKVASEEVKFQVNKKGFISEISKEVENGLGEAVGINFVKKEDINVYIDSLKKCNDMDYFEKGIELAIQTNCIQFSPLNVGDRFCMEIDFQKDLREARKEIIRIEPK